MPPQKAHRMAEVTLHIGGRQYDLHCRDGDEDHMHRLAERVNEKAMLARRGTPGMTEVRQLLFAALFIADELDDMIKTKPRQSSLEFGTTADSDMEEGGLVDRINALAARIESLSQKLAP